MEMECKRQPTVNIINSSFSSDVASIPLSQNLGEISSFSDISDSELDTREETSSEKNESQRKSSHSVNGNNNVIQNPIKSFQDKPSDVEKSSSVQSLNDIKFTLQENERHVNDRQLLDDIMKSIDNTIICTNNKQNMKSDFTTFPSETLIQNKNSDTLISSSQQSNRAETNNHRIVINERKYENKNRFEDTLKQGVSGDTHQNASRSNNNVHIKSVFGYNSLGPDTNKHFVEEQMKVTGNVSSLMKTVDRDDYKIQSVNQQKHVTFLNHTSEIPTKDEQEFLPNELTLEEINNECHVKLQEKLLLHLSKIRWHLGGWEDIQLSPPDGERESEAFMNKVMQLLQEQKLKKKHLEEELYVARNSLAKATEEVYVLRRLKESRNARINEADTQLKNLHSEWARSQKETKNDIIKLNKNCAQLKEIKKQLESQIEDLKHKNTNLMLVKTENHRMNLTIEEMRMQLTESRRHSAEVVEENERLNSKLQELTPKLKHLDEVEMPKITQDCRILKDKCLSLEEEVKTSTLAKLHLEGDLDLLKKQHSSLLQKVMQQEQQKQEVTIECDNFKKQYMDIQQKIYSSKEEIRCHYQQQMENLMAKKSENFQEQLNNHVTGLKENLLTQLNTQRDAHNHQLEIMRKEHKEETERLNIHWQNRVTQLERELTNAKYMNERLIAQRKGFIVAVTAILGPNEAYNLVGNLSNQHLNSQSYSISHINHEVPKKPSEIGKTSHDPSAWARSNSTERVVKRRTLHSRNNSRPNSGTKKETLRLPLIVGNDTSSETDASDGRTTVRHAVSGQNRNVNSNPASNVEPRNLSYSSGNRNTFGSRNIANNTNSQKTTTDTISHKNKYDESASHIPMQHVADFNVKSKNINYYEQSKHSQSSKLIVDLNSKNNLQEINSENINSSSNSVNNQKHMPRDNDIGVNQNNQEASNCVYQISQKSHLLTKQMCKNNEESSNINNQVLYRQDNFTQKINLASDILEANDTLDSDESEIQKKQISIVDEEMARLVEELKKLHGSSVGTCESTYPSADDEVPTHDTSVERDPASVALHKINQVSSLLTQYVHES